MDVNVAAIIVAEGHFRFPRLSRAPGLAPATVNLDITHSVWACRLQRGTEAGTRRRAFNPCAALEPYARYGGAKATRCRAGAGHRPACRLREGDWRGLDTLTAFCSRERGWASGCESALKILTCFRRFRDPMVVAQGREERRDYCDSSCSWDYLLSLPEPPPARFCCHWLVAASVRFRNISAIDGSSAHPAARDRERQTTGSWRSAFNALIFHSLRHCFRRFWRRTLGENCEWRHQVTPLRDATGIHRRETSSLRDYCRAVAAHRDWPLMLK